MADATVLVVGIPLVRHERESHDHGNDEFEEDEDKSSGYKDGVDYVVDPFNEKPNPIKWFGAGYENHAKGSPTAIIGIEIFSTWNDAIEMTPAVFAKIAAAKKVVKEKLGKAAKAWVIGHQT